MTEGSAVEWFVIVRESLKARPFGFAGGGAWNNVFVLLLLLLDIFRQQFSSLYFSILDILEVCKNYFYNFFDPPPYKINWFSPPPQKKKLIILYTDSVSGVLVLNRIFFITTT